RTTHTYIKKKSPSPKKFTLSPPLQQAVERGEVFTAQSCCCLQSTTHTHTSSSATHTHTHTHPLREELIDSPKTQHTHTHTHTPVKRSFQVIPKHTEHWTLLEKQHENLLLVALPTNVDRQASLRTWRLTKEMETEKKPNHRRNQTAAGQ